VCTAALFESTLNALHQHLGDKPERIPRLGGRELDLHWLYKTVCSLQGCAHVISRKLWREVCCLSGVLLELWLEVLKV
jgi:hypothetical protein